MASIISKFLGGFKMIKLYHYSNQDFKGYISPDFFGKNSYTDFSVKISSVNRSYFYMKKSGKEIYFNNCNFLYVAEIDKNKLFDIKRNSLFESFDNGGWDFEKRLKKIKKLGYIGVIGDNGFKVVCLFKKIKYIDKKTI
jgi:hypothetical protein